MASTVREELSGIILGEVDGLVTRLEKLPPTVNEAADNLSRSAESFKSAIGEYTEQVKADLEGHAENTLKTVKARAETDLRVILEGESRKVFQQYAFHEVEKLLAAQRSIKPTAQPRESTTSKLVLVLALTLGAFLGFVSAVAWLR